MARTLPPPETLDRIREAVGTAAWLSLYQQRPVREEGAIFRKTWWRSYDAPPEPQRLVFSLDTAFKVKQSADYSVIEVWGETSSGYYLLHVWRQRAEFPELTRQATALAAIWKPNAVLIEDAASGQSLIQALKAETRLPVLPVRPSGDKVARASAVSPLVEAGKVFLPKSAPWLADFMEEVSTFPASPHDDTVDAMSQALNYLRGARGMDDSDRAFQQRANEYLAAQARVGHAGGRSSSSRLYGDGTQLCEDEDRAATRARIGLGSRWRRSAW